MLVVSAVTIVSVALLALFAPLASALEVHTYSESFGGGELSMTWQSSIEVDQETGEVYVADTEHSRIAKFTAAGIADGALATTFKPTAIAIDNSPGPSRGDIYALAADSRTITKLDPAGLPVTSWGSSGQLIESEEVIGIAVDPSGNLWVMTQDLVFNPEKLPAMEVPQEDTIVLRGFDQAGHELEGAGWTRIYRSSHQGETESESASVFGGPYSHSYQGDMSLDTGGTLYALGVAWSNGHGVEAYERFQRKMEAIGPNGKPISSSIGIRGESFLGNAIDLSGGRFYAARIQDRGEPREENSHLEAYPLQGLGAGTPPLEAFGGAWEIPKRYLNAVYGTSVDGLQEPASVAVYEGDHSVYVADPASQKIIVYRLENVEPPSVVLGPAEDIGYTSAHFIGQIDPGTPPPTGSHVRDIAWEFNCTPKCPALEGHIENPERRIEADGAEHEIDVTLEGLEPGTEYSVRLAAENHGEIARSEPQVFLTTPLPPSVTGRPASEVARGEATLNAIVNSDGLPTTYRFEYTTKSTFDAEGFSGAKSTPEEGPLPAPASPRPVSARIAGLEPATEYVFRAIATNSLGTAEGEPVSFRSQVGPNPPQTDCPNQALRTGVGARLPDCRAYEMATPVEKGGNLVEPYAGGLQAATDGSGVTWFTGQGATGIPSPQAGHQGYAFYLSTLTGDSWSSQRLLAPPALGELSALVGLTGDGRYALIETAASRVFNSAGEERWSEPALYLLDTASQVLTAIVPPQAGKEEVPRAFALDGASADGSLIFFESHLQLTPRAAPGKNNLYVWNRASGALSLAGALPGAAGDAPAGGSFGGAYSWWGGKANLETGGAEEGQYVEAAHAISETGDAVYFTAGITGQLYLRHGLTGPKPTTVRVSTPNSGVTDPNGQQPAAFQEATPDGSKAFFLSAGRLTQDANTGSADEGSDLYRYDPAAKKPLVDVTPLPGGAGAQVQGVLGVSADGRSGYFVAKGVLTAEGAVEGHSNLYHFQEEAEGAFSYAFVADLGNIAGTPAERNWSPTPSRQKTARVSSDGATVLFMSHRALTGAPEAACIVAGSCMQVYRYSTSEESLACLSCNPTGEGAPRFGAELSLEAQGTLIPDNSVRSGGSGISGILPANLSSSGNRAFFITSESLLPEDVNGSEPTKECASPYVCADVYEWEAVGTGSCTTPNHAGGCLYLLSTGENDESSYFVNASTDGSSAFIMTSSSLVPADTDELSDVYDARIGGGLNAQHATPDEPCGSAEACKGQRATPPPVASSGTSTFSGPGNPSVKPCKKGFVRKHGRCVKKQRKRHHRKHGHGRKAHKTGHRATGKKHTGGAK